MVWCGVVLRRDEKGLDWVWRRPAAGGGLVLRACGAEQIPVHVFVLSPGALPADPQLRHWIGVRSEALRADAGQADLLQDGPPKSHHNNTVIM